jgi:hypothetical protein
MMRQLLRHVREEGSLNKDLQAVPFPATLLALEAKASIDRGAGHVYVDMYVGFMHVRVCVHAGIYYTFVDDWAHVSVCICTVNPR